ncbi:hypothetical protein EDD17DRAFT_254929 [Pisolithus thermaeus]|nr:hypothetical protein EDD17DRAFT_254929 [Pisolithus thermaeus]
MSTMTSISSTQLALLLQPRAVALPPSSNPRVALHDSTNTSPCLGKRSIDQIQPYSTRQVTFPTSSARLQGSSARCYNLSGSPPRFPVAHKAPPTVSISFSSACSRRREKGLDAQDPELPDVRNVVPFPCSPLDSNGDVEMLDGTYPPSKLSTRGLSLPPLGPPPPLRRKRRSAYSVSAPTSPSNRTDGSSKDSRDGSVRKRARKTKRQAADMIWLGVMHRSISLGLCESESTSPCHVDTCACNGNGGCRRLRRKTIEAQDRLLAGKIWQKLIDNGCHSGPMTGAEGRTVRLPPSEVEPETGPVCRQPPAAASSVAVLEFPRPPSPRSNPLFFPKPSSPIAVPSTPQTTYDCLMLSPTPLYEKDVRPCTASPKFEPTPLQMDLRRSPSPPLLQRTPSASRSATPTPQSPATLTMPQLVASLILSHRERGSLRTKSKSSPGKSKREDVCHTGESASQECGGSSEELEGRHEVTRMSKSHALWNAGRPSPLCQVAYYVEDPELNSPC